MSNVGEPSRARKENAMKDFVIQLAHRSGELARVTNALSLYGVNIKSVAAMRFGEQALLHLVPDDVDSARSALEAGNIPFEEHELAIVLLENRAGELTGVAAGLADAGVNLEAAFVVGLADDLIELAIVADNVKKAKKVLES
jgi:hypothetical protein